MRRNSLCCNEFQSDRRAMAKSNGKPRERTSNITELADFAGVSRNTIYEWMKLSGFPKAKDGTVCKWEMCEWYLTRLTPVGAGDADPEAGGDSPGLERYRLARAGQEEIKLAQLRGQVMDRDWVHGKLMEIASLIRGCGEQLQREYGDDARQILDQSMDDVDGKIGEWVDEAESDDDVIDGELE